MADHIRREEGLDPVAVKFPETGYIGVAAEFAELYSQAYESPKEFLYMDCLALIGASASGRVRADFDLPAQPRLYLLKVSKSAWRRKSTSTRMAEKFVSSALVRVPRLLSRDWARVINGVGSAEGAAGALKRIMIQKETNEQPELWQETRRAVVCFDEFRRFESKAAIKGSALLPLVNELYESNEYGNLTVDETRSFEIQDGHLVFLSNSTDETFKNMINAAEFRDLGFFNRIFIIGSDSRKRVAKPKAPKEELLNPIRAKLTRYFADLPPLAQEGNASEERVIPLTPEAESKWEHWYYNLPEAEETARLDNLGMRLMGLLAFTDGRKSIDEALLQSVLDILEYQRRVRLLYRPIEADNPKAKMEQKICEAIRRHGPLSRRELYKHTHAERAGVDVFNDAMRNFTHDSVGVSQILVFKDDKFHLVDSSS